jgi:solute carrier family 15 oligopeptide transporter 1
VYLSLVYIFGGVLLVLFSWPGFLGTPNSERPIPLWGPITALLLVSLGAGGIKACVSAHGGDQYLKNQQKAITLFFTLFYTAINLGALISGYLTPILKDINWY